MYEKFPFIHTRSWIAKNFPDKGKLLDVGCGSGGFIVMIKKLKPHLEIYGTDINQNPTLPKYIHFFKSDFNEKIDSESNKFDVIISTHVLEHLQNPDICVKEMYRVAKKGAKVFVEVPSARSLFLPSFSSVGRAQDIPINFYDDPTHIRPYTRRALHSLLSFANFKVIKTGHARHYGALLLSPLLFIYAIFSSKREFLVHSLWNLVGWPCYVLAKK